MKQSIFEIISNDALADSVYKMVLAGDTSDITNCGQFVNIQLDGLFLRRPISVCDYDDKTLTIVYKVVGKGTEAMSKMVAGQKNEFKHASVSAMADISQVVDCSSGKGSVVVQVYTANGSLPVQGAKVIIEGINGTKLYELYTDNGGRTKSVELCVPPAKNSQTQGNTDTYGVFNIRVEMQGYYTEEFLNVAVFDKIESIQPVLLEPVGENALEGDKNKIKENAKDKGQIGNGGTISDNSARVGDALIIREEPRPIADVKEGGGDNAN